MTALCLGERSLCPAGGKGRASVGKGRPPGRNPDWEVVATGQAVQWMLKRMQRAVGLGKWCHCKERPPCYLASKRIPHPSPATSWGLLRLPSCTLMPSQTKSTNWERQTQGLIENLRVLLPIKQLGRGFRCKIS